MKCISDTNIWAVKYPPLEPNIMEEIKTTKICSRCKRELPLDMFHKKTKSKDGLQCECIDCRREMMRKTNKIKVFSNPELAKFQPRELIAELRARRYSGELTYIQKIVI